MQLKKIAKANCILAMLLFLLQVVVAVVVVALLIMQARSTQAVPLKWFLPRQQCHLPRLPHWLPIVGTFACRRSRFQFSLRKWALGSNACLGCPPSHSPPLSLYPLYYLLLLSAAVAPVRSCSQSLLRVATCVINKNVWQSRRIYGMLASSTLTCRRH